MADVVLNQTLFEGDKKLVTHYQNVSDNAGGTTKIVDVSGLTARGDGATPATVTLNKIWYSISMTAKVDAVKLMWDADTDATFLTVEGDGYLDYSSIGGIKNMTALPDAIFVVDVGFESGAVVEATKLGIPIIGVVDTNNSTDNIAYVIPGNDDSSRAIRLYARGMADTILEGKNSALNEVAKMVAEEAIVDEAAAEIEES